jgi:hypothetical protein
MKSKCSRKHNSFFQFYLEIQTFLIFFSRSKTLSKYWLLLIKFLFLCCIIINWTKILFLLKHINIKMKSDRKEAKIVLIGDTQVRKTNILKRVTTKSFQITTFPQLEQLTWHIIFKLIMTPFHFKHGTIQVKSNATAWHQCSFKM